MGTPGGVPEHIEGTNMDENDMPDPFQALPEAKTPLKHRNMIDFRVNKFPKFSPKFPNIE